jgi:hypothetical protein
VNAFVILALFSWLFVTLRKEEPADATAPAEATTG